MMADELTGLVDEETDELDFDVSDLDDDTPDETDASPPDPPSQTASDLAKKLNVDELPADADELYAVVTKRLDELRDMGRKSGEDTKAEVATLRAELDQYKQMLAPRPRSGPPAGASDEEILNWYVDRRLEEKVAPLAQQNQQMATYQATQMVEAARARYSDFDQNEDAIVGALQRFPQMTLDEAYNFVTADKAEERALEKFKASIEAKKKSTGTLTRGGASSTSLKEPDKVREIPERSFWDFAYKAAKREQGIE